MIKKTINDLLVERILNIKNKINVINFWSIWCIPCKILIKILKEIKKKYKKINTLNINIDFNYYTSEKFFIKIIPTIIIIKNKNIIIKKTGIINKNYLKNIIKKIYHEKKN